MKPSDPLWVIRWRDIVTRSGWTDIIGLEEWENEDEIVLSVGWIVKETEEYLFLAGTLFNSGSPFSDVHKIPLGNILSRENVEIVNRKSEKEGKGVKEVKGGHVYIPIGRDSTRTRIPLGRDTDTEG